MFSFESINIWLNLFLLIKTETIFCTWNDGAGQNLIEHTWSQISRAKSRDHLADLFLILTKIYRLTQDYMVS